MLSHRAFSISASTILQLYINYPHWRLAICLRLLDVLFAASTITCNALILVWNPIPKGTPWWNLQSLNKGIPFLLCSFSILWAIASIVKLFATRKPIHPGADVGVDLFILLLLAPTIVFAILNPSNQLHFDGLYEIQTVAGKLEIVALIGLIVLLIVHFCFFAWGCRRVDVKRRLERRESCDKCLTMQLREKMGSRGSSIEPMPSREYGRYHQANQVQIQTPPTAVISSAATSPTAVSPLFSDNISYPPLGSKVSELDVERGHKPWVSTRPRYYQIEDDEDDEVPPPTPPPKPREDRLGQVPYPSSIPEFLKMDRQASRSPLPSLKQRDYRRNFDEVEEPRRAYSISSYYMNKSGS